MKMVEFWKHIELSKRLDPQEHEKRLVKRLSKRYPNLYKNFGTELG